MANFRQKMKVQKVSNKVVEKIDPFVPTRKNRREETKKYIRKAISMYEIAVTSFTPLSDEEEICRNQILRLTIDLEILENSSRADCEEVVNKYG